MVQPVRLLLPGEGEPEESKGLDHNCRSPARVNFAVFVMPGTLELHDLVKSGADWRWLSSLSTWVGICRRFG